MKNLLIALMLFTSFCSLAQTKVPYVDYKGHIYYQNKQIGNLTKDGSLDNNGKVVTKVNGNGEIIDSNGKQLGKLAKGSSFVYYFNDKTEKYTIGKPSHNGMCEVKNSDGQTVMLLHNNYKQQVACAIHCLNENHCMPSDAEHKHK
ncbi:hypothetical protein EOJ36_09545 [Sandaracinomonas limnophila]|uniref:Uncharacterized protein n=1 Tax=Sandaracinomonas limnophila TaxID=1862386 RepID=A0A437PPR9_9BACT|nr:hypothetical protein [Sandaracinomonas limnophila]RVU24159.1 hypothetical protein EOJ36_09545 [Sandaracinomonas limnophila]